MDPQPVITWSTLLYNGLHIALIVLIGLLMLRSLGKLMARLESRLLRIGAVQGERPWEAQRRVETLTRLLRQAITIVVFASLGLALLMQLGVQVGPILASAGVIGVAVGFGAQNLVRDLLSGFFLILENQVRVGDVAIVNGTGGLVEAVNFRTLVLRGEDGGVHFISNGLITSLSNLTREWSAYVFELRLNYKEDIDRVLDIIREVAGTMKADSKIGLMMIDQPEIYGIDRLTDTAVAIKGRIRTKPIKQWEVGREFLSRIKRAFDEAGVDIPIDYYVLRYPPALSHVADAEYSRHNKH